MAKVYSKKERIDWIKSLHGNPAGAMMLLETSEKRLLIVKANYREHWTLPGGVIDKGESPLQAALREVREEVGLIIEPSKVRFAGVEYRHDEEVDLYRFVFRSFITDEQAAAVKTRDSEIEAYVFETAQHIKAGKRRYARNIEIWASEEQFPTYSEEAMAY